MDSEEYGGYIKLYGLRLRSEIFCDEMSGRRRRTCRSNNDAGRERDADIL